MKCRACSRQADGKYCAYHGRALEQLRQHHSAWVRAYGDISWEKYIKKLSGMKETGTFVKEVIEAELEK